MKATRLLLMSVLSAVFLFPLAARADEKSSAKEARGEGTRDDRDGGPHGGMHDGHGRFEPDPEMKAKMEKVRAVEDKLRDFPKRLRLGTDAERVAAKTEARKLLAELFDAKLAADEAVLAKMEKHVAEMRERTERKKTSREKMIEGRLSRMSGEGEDW